MRSPQQPEPGPIADALRRASVDSLFSLPAPFLLTVLCNHVYLHEEHTFENLMSAAVPHLVCAGFILLQSVAISLREVVLQGCDRTQGGSPRARSEQDLLLDPASEQEGGPQTAHGYGSGAADEAEERGTVSSPPMATAVALPSKSSAGQQVVLSCSAVSSCFFRGLVGFLNAWPVTLLPVIKGQSSANRLYLGPKSAVYSIMFLSNRFLCQWIADLHGRVAEHTKIPGSKVNSSSSSKRAQLRSSGPVSPQCELGSDPCSFSCSSIVLLIGAITLVAISQTVVIAGLLFFHFKSDPGLNKNVRSRVADTITDSIAIFLPPQIITYISLFFFYPEDPEHCTLPGNATTDILHDRSCQWGNHFPEWMLTGTTAFTLLVACMSYCKDSNQIRGRASGPSQQSRSSVAV